MISSVSAEVPVSVPQFEGPLDLLVSLVHRNQIDIRNLSIAAITSQYLAYLKENEILDADRGSEWFHMAATLIQIKSRSLLPFWPEAGEADPRKDLVRQILDHQKLKEATAFLAQNWEGAFPSPRDPVGPEGSGESKDVFPPNSMSLQAILELARTAAAASRSLQPLETPAAAVSTEEMLTLVEHLLAGLGAEQRLAADLLWQDQPTAGHRVALFLALLEGARRRSFDLEQTDSFQPVAIVRPQTSAQPE